MSIVRRYTNYAWVQKQSSKLTCAKVHVQPLNFLFFKGISSVYIT